ncbi:hypothetical protein HPB48_007565 [Haemaphysalis longicornis]|uniref:Uncharacterized protein n=1 Tax=Haemaphysalis longicornis TaxID=44386 RepID=A0A9J6F6Y4_HAELO|nr:hypothetical protein HPB48_007565 [Haemaphysalis longicornis]
MEVAVEREDIPLTNYKRMVGSTSTMSIVRTPPPRRIPPKRPTQLLGPTMRRSSIVRARGVAFHRRRSSLKKASKLSSYLMTDSMSAQQANILDAVYKAAGLSYLQGEQLRTNVTSNLFMFSTPSEERCSVIALIKHINIRGQTFEVATNVAAPSCTATGIIFNVPIDDTPEVITESLVRFNPTCSILNARRMGNSNAVQILFEGTIIPYHISYRGATYRCQPFRRKTEACTTCWRTGHRPDVCPTSQVRCQKCGLLNPNPEHPRQPKCVVCQCTHITGSAECRSRFQPRRRPPPLNKQQHLPWQQPPPPPPPPPVPGCPED